MRRPGSTGRGCRRDVVVAEVGDLGPWGINNNCEDEFAIGLGRTDLLFRAGAGKGFGVMARSESPRAVGVFSTYGTSYGRAIAIGAAHQFRAAGYRPVSCMSGFSQPDPNLAGYVGLFGDKEAEIFLASGTKAVNVSQTSAVRLRLPSVLPDNAAAGRLAAQHLVERGYQTILFAERPGMLYSEARAAGVQAVVRRAGGMYLPVTNPQAEASFADVPLPFGIIGADDTMASRAMETVLRLARHVPDEVAVVGITNDEYECITAVKPLTSVDLKPGVIGHRAAGLLLRLIAGRSAPPAPLLVSPGPVVTRSSSDALATTNRTIARVVRYARDHLDGRLEVRHLAEHFRMSRQHLNLIFREAGYCTPVEMLQHLAVVRAKHLLASTDLTIPEIAAKCGYIHLAHFGVMFRKISGTPPAAYRQQWR